MPCTTQYLIENAEMLHFPIHVDIKRYQILPNET